jgi:hypothetical protein
VFSEKPEVTKLVLRNCNGDILCRKNFGTETFFQTNTGNFEDIEITASSYLMAYRNAGFI